MIVDASALVQLVLLLPGWERVAERIADRDVAIHVPHLALVEVTQAIRRHERAGGISADTGAAAVTDLADLDLILHDHDLLLPRIWDLRANLSAYDASYVALAEVLDQPLLTFDRRLASAAGHHAVIELLAA